MLSKSWRHPRAVSRGSRWDIGKCSPAEEINEEVARLDSVIVSKLVFCHVAGVKMLSMVSRAPKVLGSS